MSEEKLIALLKPLIKPATRLILARSEKAYPASCESKFGGLPYAEQDDICPVCPTCNEELSFIAQLKHPNEKSLLTLFLCAECYGIEDEEEGQWVIRSYENPNMQKYVEIKPIQIESWSYDIEPCLCSEESINTLPSLTDVCDYIFPNEFEALYLESGGKWEYYCDMYESIVKDCGCFPNPETVIGGHPDWVQDKEVPFCTLCHAEMDFFAHIGVEDEANFMWGDCGAVYLFRCPEHKNEFKLVAQCH